MNFEQLTARPSGVRRGFWAVVTAARSIADVGHYLKYDGGKEAEAYARLFASAPKLRSALEEIAFWNLDAPPGHADNMSRAEAKRLAQIAIGMEPDPEARS